MVRTARTWLEANDGFRRDVLDLLGSSGPLLSRDIPDTCVQPWRSTGWTHSRNATQMLEFLTMRGGVAISGRRGRHDCGISPGGCTPDGVTAVPSDDARRQRYARRVRALGIARETMREVPGEPYAVGEAGEPATVEGVAGP